VVAINVYTPEYFNADIDDLTIIGAVALPGGPANINISDLPKTAVSSTINGNTSVKDTGRKETMFVITAIFTDEFVKDRVYIEHPVAPLPLPCSMTALLGELQATPYVPIYSKQLYSLLGFNEDSYSYDTGLTAVLTSIKVQSINDFNHAYQVDMQFNLTNMNAACGGLVSFVDKDDDKETSRLFMYSSEDIIKRIDDPKGERETTLADELRTSALFETFNLGIDLYTIQSKIEQYKDKIAELAKQTWGTNKEKEVESELEKMQSMYRELKQNIETSNTALLKEASDLAKDSHAVEVYNANEGSSTATRIRFNTLSSVAIGYDNIVSPIYLQDSEVPIHILTGRSPTSGTVSVVVNDTRDIAAVKALHSKLQRMIRKLEFMNNTLPCSVENELTSMFNMDNITLTRMDVQTPEETQNTFIMRLNFASGYYSDINEKLTYVNYAIQEEVMKAIDEAIFPKNSTSIGKILDDGWMKDYKKDDEVAAFMVKPYVELLRSTYRGISSMTLGITLLIELINRSDPDTVESLVKALNKMTNNKFSNLINPGSKNNKLVLEYTLEYPKYSQKASKALLAGLSLFREEAYKEGIKGATYQTAIDLTFASKDKTLPLSLQRLMGFRTRTIVPEETSSRRQLSGLFPTVSIPGGANANSRNLFLLAGREITLEDGTTKIFGKEVIDRGLSDSIATYENKALEFAKTNNDIEIYPKLNKIRQMVNDVDTEYTHNIDMLSKVINTNEPMTEQEIKIKYHFLKALYIEALIEFGRFNTTSPENLRELEYLSGLSQTNIREFFNRYSTAEEAASALEQQFNVLAEEPRRINDVTRRSDVNLNEDYIPILIETEVDSQPMKTVCDRVGKSSINNFDVSMADKLFSDFEGAEKMEDISFVPLRVHNIKQDSAFETPDITDVFSEDSDYFFSIPDVSGTVLEDTFRQVGKILISYIVNGNGDDTENSKMDRIRRLVSFPELGSPVYITYINDMAKGLEYITYPHNIEYLPAFGTKIFDIVNNYYIEDAKPMVDLSKFYIGNAFDIAEIKNIVTDYKNAVDKSGQVNAKGELTEIPEDNELDQLKAWLDKIAADAAKSLEHGNEKYTNHDQLKSLRIDLLSHDTLTVPRSGTSAAPSNSTVEEKVQDVESAKKWVEEELKDEEPRTDLINQKIRDIIKATTEINKTRRQTEEEALIIPNDTATDFRNTTFEQAIDNIDKSIMSLDMLCPVITVQFRWPKRNILLTSSHLFSYNGVVSVDISKAKDNPGHTAVIVLSNTTGKLVQETKNNRQEIGNTLDSLLITPGVDVDVYEGVGTNKKLAFRGTISNVQFGTEVSIVATGHGGELMTPVFASNEKLGGMATSPREMVVDALMKTGSEHFGVNENGFFRMLLKSVFAGSSLDYLKAYSDKYIFRKLRYRDALSSIYFPDKYWPILGQFRDHTGANNFEQYGADYSAQPGYSAWDVVTDAVRRVPGFVAYVVDYDSGDSRLFYGKPDWYYKFTKIISPEFWTRIGKEKKESAYDKLKAAVETFKKQTEDRLGKLTDDIKTDSTEYQITKTPDSMVKKINVGKKELYIDTSCPVYELPEYYEGNGDWIAGKILEDYNGTPYITPTHVIDGDTFYFKSPDGQEKIRLLGVDTPEINDEYYAEEAYETLCQLLGVKPAQDTENTNYSNANGFDGRNIIAYYTGTTDSYGRKVCRIYVEINGEYIDVANTLLLNGYGDFFMPQYHELSTPYMRAEKYAVVNKLGVKESLSDENVNAIVNTTDNSINNRIKILDETADDLEEKYLSVKDWLNRYYHGKKVVEGAGKYIHRALHWISKYYSDVDSFVMQCKRKLVDLRDSLNEGKESDSIDRIALGLLRRPQGFINTLRMILESPMTELQNNFKNAIGTYMEGVRTQYKIKNLKEMTSDGTQSSDQMLKQPFYTGTVKPFPGTKHFRNYWTVTGGLNLIDNGVFTSSDNVANSITVRGLRRTAQIPLFGAVFKFFQWLIGLAPGADEVDGNMALYRVMFDDNIPEYMKRSLVYEDEWADTTQTRILVGATVLAQSLSNMYQGEITILGNSEIKPHDVIVLSDEFNDMYGMAVVKSVKHHLGGQLGFVTKLEIEPMMSFRDLHSSMSATILKTLLGIAAIAALWFFIPPLAGAITPAALMGSAVSVMVFRLAPMFVKSQFLDYTDIVKPSLEIDPKDSSVIESGQMNDTYGTSSFLYNPIIIKPLMQHNKPMTAGLGGYKLNELNALSYRLQKWREMWDNVKLGTKVFGTAWSMIFNYARSWLNSALHDIEIAKMTVERMKGYERD